MNDAMLLSFQNKRVKKTRACEELCVNELFWPGSREFLTQPVKTQIAVRFIVLLGYAPERGFVQGVQKRGNEIVTQTEAGEEYFTLQNGGDVTVGLCGVR